MPSTASTSSTRFAPTVLALASLVAAIAVGQPAHGNDQSSAQEVRRVENQYVCMINNTVFEKVQIPVEVDGKTYYGCCAMCKERLAQDPTSRQAADPVTGEMVDKANAVIAARANGTVLYFSSQENLDKYLEQAAASAAPAAETKPAGNASTAH